MRITGFIFLLVSALFFYLPFVIVRNSQPSIMIIDPGVVVPFIICWPIGLLFGIAGFYLLLAKSRKTGTTGPSSYQFACHACGAQGFTAIKDRCPSCETPLG